MKDGLFMINVGASASNREEEKQHQVAARPARRRGPRKALNGVHQLQCGSKQADSYVVATRHMCVAGGLFQWVGEARNKLPI